MKVERGDGGRQGTRVNSTGSPDIGCDRIIVPRHQASHYTSKPHRQLLVKLFTKHHGLSPSLIEPGSTPFPLLLPEESNYEGRDLTGKHATRASQNEESSIDGNTSPQSIRRSELRRKINVHLDFSCSGLRILRNIPQATALFSSHLTI